MLNNIDPNRTTQKHIVTKVTETQERYGYYKLLREMKNLKYKYKT